MDFAEIAIVDGWNDRTLAQFCRAHLISLNEQRQRWPKGVRSVAREFNDHADRVMLEGMLRDPAASLSEVMLRRFEDNEGFKESVRRLAWSDLFHPIDTFSRTMVTARHMVRGPAATAPIGQAKIWWLALLYSICVLIWFADRPPYSRLRRAIDAAARMCSYH